MATRQEIIEIIDAFLDNRITQREAYDWASEELHRAPDWEDQAGALITFIGAYVPKEAMVRPLREQLILDREVLVRGVPCPPQRAWKNGGSFLVSFYTAGKDRCLPDQNN